MKNKMLGLLIFLSLLHPQILTSKPPKEIPHQLYIDYTMNGKIPVRYWYFDSTRNNKKEIEFNYDYVEKLIQRASKKHKINYGITDSYLYQALDEYVGNFEGKIVGVIGSTSATYEAITISYDGLPVTVEYNKIISHHPKIKTMTVDEYNRFPVKFDYLISISSIEHDGLGRYGDPLNPNGDLLAMEKAREMLNENGLFFLAVPVGEDYLIWNAHRIYGEKRLHLLLQSWNIIGSVGFIEADLKEVNNGEHQPVFILGAKNK